jgi:hypothetical protein
VRTPPCLGFRVWLYGLPALDELEANQQNDFALNMRHSRLRALWLYFAPASSCGLGFRIWGLGFTLRQLLAAA